MNSSDLAVRDEILAALGVVLPIGTAVLPALALMLLCVGALRLARVRNS